MKYSIQEDDLSQVENSMVIGDDEETIVADPDRDWETYVFW